MRQAGTDTGPVMNSADKTLLDKIADLEKYAADWQDEHGELCTENEHLVAKVEDLESESERLRDSVEQEHEWRITATRQVMRLNQCVECGEMDEQDGSRVNGEFRCTDCPEPEQEGFEK